MSNNYSISEKVQLAVWYVADKIKRNLSLSDPKAWSPALWNLYGVSQTESGIQVTEETAINLSSVFAGINIISSDISTCLLYTSPSPRDRS